MGPIHSVRGAIILVGVRIFEGDLVVAIRRAPSISLPAARELDLQTHHVLRKLPEVVSTVAMTGRAEVALDTVGNDNTDILVKLRPKKEWRDSPDFDGLSAQIKAMVESEVPGTFVSVSQPIEDQTNEILSGSRANVQIQVFGPDLEGLTRLTTDIGRMVSGKALATPVSSAPSGSRRSPSSPTERRWRATGCVSRTRSRQFRRREKASRSGICMTGCGAARFALSTHRLRRR